MFSAKVATLNVENLFARFKFKANVKMEKVVQDGWNIDGTCFTIFNEKEKAITAETIKALDADVIALQEVSFRQTCVKISCQMK